MARSGWRTAAGGRIPIASQEFVLAVRIRLKRTGRRHRPFYRIAAVDQRKARDSRVIEDLGYFDPVNKDEDKQLKLNEERARYWLSVGAQPTERVHSILRSKGLLSSQWRRNSKQQAIGQEEASAEA